MKSLLIVDDERKICEVLSRFFAARGFQTETVQSGYEAIARLDEASPDYLLLDIRMPDMSGLDVLRQAKARHPALRVVMVTAIGDEETMQTAYELGAADYVTKPFHLNDQSWARAFFAAE